MMICHLYHLFLKLLEFSSSILLFSLLLCAFNHSLWLMQSFVTHRILVRATGSVFFFLFFFKFIIIIIIFIFIFIMFKSLTNFPSFTVKVVLLSPSLNICAHCFCCLADDHISISKHHNQSIYLTEWLLPPLSFVDKFTVQDVRK